MPDQTKQTSEEVKIALDYANNIIATLRESFLVIDKNLRIVSTNSSFCTTFKVTAKETIGQLLPDLGNRQWNIPKLIILLKEILPQQKVVTDYEVEHKFETIGHRIMNLNACQIRIPKKIATLLTTKEEEAKEEDEEELTLLAIEDITERKKMEQVKIQNLAMEDINKTKDDFLNIAAHDLRTPMAGIRANTEMILNGDYGDIPPKFHQPLVDIDKANLSLIKMIDDFLTISRIEKGKITITPKPIDILPILQNIIKQTKIRVENNSLQFYNLKFTSTIPDKLPLILTDADKISEVINNLVDNAIKFTDKGSINFNVTTKKDSLVVSVKDTGIGIAKERQKDLFKKYSQLGAKKRIAYGKGTGLGLGLYISRLIIEGCKGKIWVESELGMGSTFNFSLPIANIN